MPLWTGKINDGHDAAQHHARFRIAHEGEYVLHGDDLRFERVHQLAQVAVDLKEPLRDVDLGEVVMAPHLRQGADAGRT